MLDQHPLADTLYVVATIVTPANGAHVPMFPFTCVTMEPRSLGRDTTERTGRFFLYFRSSVSLAAGTALHYACNYERGECAKILIDHGADLNKKSAELQLVALHLGRHPAPAFCVSKIVRSSFGI